MLQLFPFAKTLLKHFLNSLYFILILNLCFETMPIYFHYFIQIKERNAPILDTVGNNACLIITLDFLLLFSKVFQNLFNY